jgi:hypothetical protein
VAGFERLSLGGFGARWQIEQKQPPPAFGQRRCPDPITRPDRAFGGLAWLPQ